MANPNFPNNPGYNLYVGARYVPLFANPIEWDESKTYEPLTIVTHQGNSYTSKTFVPANTDITDTTYWALTGNYNAQVEQYRQEVLNYANNSESYFIQTSVLNRLMGKKILVVGASNEIEDTANYTTWAKLLKDKLNGIAEVTINAIGGRRFDGAHGCASIAMQLAGNYDIIIISGLKNSWLNKATWSASSFADNSITGRLQHISASINDNKWYNKEIYILGMFKGIAPENFKTVNIPSAALLTLVKSYCDRVGFTFVDTTNAMGTYAPANIASVTVGGDGIHFNTPYTQNACDYILAHLLYKESDRVKVNTIYDCAGALTVPDSSAQINNADLYCFKDTYKLVIDLNITESINNGTSKGLISVDENFFKIMSRGPVYGWCAINGVSVSTAGIAALSVNNQIWVRAIGANLTGTCTIIISASWPSNVINWTEQ